MYARSSLPPTPARFPRLRLLMILCRWPLDTINPDEIFLDESNFGRLRLDDPAVCRQPSEEALPQPETFPISPTWGSHQILEPKTLYPAGVGNFGLQDPLGSTTDASGLIESWTTPFPSGASFNVSTSITHSDAKIRVPSPGESLHAEQHQDMHLGTHLRDNCIK